MENLFFNTIFILLFVTPFLKVAYDVFLKRSTLVESDELMRRWFLYHYNRREIAK